MASQSDGKEKDEKEELEEELKSLTCRKKDVFEKTKETDRELWEIRQREIAVKERLEQLSSDRIELEQSRQALERLQVENAKLKELLSQRAAESDSKIEGMEAELSYVKEKVALYEREVAGLNDDILKKEMLQREVAGLKDEILEKDKLQEEVANLQAELSSVKGKIAVCEREHGGADDVNEMKEELETLRQQNVEQSAALGELKDAMQRITSYSMTQQIEKEDALKRVASLEREVLEKEKLRREVASLKDEIAALRLISEETQQRQLNELQSSFSVKKQHHQQQQQQHGTGDVDELNVHCGA